MELTGAAVAARKDRTVTRRGSVRVERWVRLTVGLHQGSIEPKRYKCGWLDSGRPLSPSHEGPSEGFAHFHLVGGLRFPYQSEPCWSRPNSFFEVLIRWFGLVFRAF